MLDGFEFIRDLQLKIESLRMEGSRLEGRALEMHQIRVEVMEDLLKIFIESVTSKND